MNVENLIYVYLAICFSMIIFNCVCVFAFRRSEENISRKSRDFEEQVTKQIDRIERGLGIDEKHIKYLCKKLKRVGNLIALDETIARMFVEDRKSVDSYIVSIRSVFIYLSLEYRHKENIQAAYFPYIVKRFQILRHKPSDLIIDILMEFLHEPSLYCRENALQAIYSAGDCDSAIAALKIIDRGSSFHHSKLLTDGLLDFAGDHRQLSAAIWKSFGEFSVSMKVTLLNYVRFGNPDCCEEIMHLLTDEGQDDEIRFACIRYVGKYYYEPAYAYLLDFAVDTGERRWEYAAIASSALASYPSERTVEVLKNNLYSSNWYIRFNASESLERLGLGYMELIDIFDGNDRYAREILQYRMDQRKARDKEAVKA